MSNKTFADWRLIRVREDGTPIVRPICPRCKHDLNNASYCTECGQEFDEDDEELQRFFRPIPADPGDGVSGRRFGKRNLVMNIFDECEIHTNCTVQILHNSVTDEYSIGWWKMKSQAFREWIDNLCNIKWTPLKAIKAKCIECCGGEGIPSKCEIKTCPLYWYLYQYRQKRVSTPKRIMSDEERAKRAEICRVAREKRAK